MGFGASNWTLIGHFRSIYSRNHSSELHEGLHPKVVQKKNTAAEVREHRAGLRVAR